MPADISLSPHLENLENLADHLRDSAAQMGLSGRHADWLVAAGSQAFSAVCLSGVDGPAKFETVTVRGELRLRLEFPLVRPGRLVGLAPSLFCPPARRAGVDILNGKGVWTAHWEV